MSLLDSNTYKLEYRTAYIGQHTYSNWVKSTDNNKYSGTYRHAIDRLQIRVKKK